MKLGSKVAVCMLAVATLGGCASVPMADADADTKAKTFVAPSSGQANIYVYRNETFGAAIKMPLLLDNQSIGDTGPHTYAFRQVAPGKHTIVSKTEKDVTLDLDVQAGNNYYVWQEVKMGMFAARSALHLVDEQTGEAGVKQCKMIQ
jgi:Protein of unknown function (DUF2846)